MSDREIKKKIDKLERIVRAWAMKFGLEEGCEFMSYTAYFGDDPDLTDPCLRVLTLGDDLLEVMRGPYSSRTDELDELMEAHLFRYDFTGLIMLFYSIDEEAAPEFADYFEWQWIMNLVKPEYTDLYGELYTYFNKHPDKFHSLHHREFEILISEIFRNNGYDILLGSGTNDKGVDIRLFSKEGIDSHVTLVQVKRYDYKYAIKLEAVSALYGTVLDQKADRGLFVTSSRYLKSAREFALRNSHKLQLADRQDIADWSFRTAQNLLDTQHDMLTERYIMDLLLPGGNNGLTGEILISYNESYFKDTCTVDFFMIIKDTRYASLIMRIPWQRTPDSQNYCGYVMPLLDRSVLAYRNKENIFRVRKVINSSGEVTFLGQMKVYSLWNGAPAFFLMD